MDGLQWKILLEWMIWGYHYFRKHPCFSSLFHSEPLYRTLRKANGFFFDQGFDGTGSLIFEPGTHHHCHSWANIKTSYNLNPPYNTCIIQVRLKTLMQLNRSFQKKNSIVWFFVFSHHVESRRVLRLLGFLTKGTRQGSSDQLRQQEPHHGQGNIYENLSGTWRSWRRGDGDWRWRWSDGGLAEFFSV